MDSITSSVSGLLLSQEGVAGFRAVGSALRPGLLEVPYREATRRSLNGPKSTAHEYLIFRLPLVSGGCSLQQVGERRRTPYIGDRFDSQHSLAPGGPTVPV